MMNPNFGFDLGFNYVSGNTLKSSYHNDIGSGFADVDNSLNKSNLPPTSITGTMFTINPSIVFATHLDILKPYARFGLLVGFGTINTVNESKFPDSSFGGIVDFREAWKYSGGVSLGYNTVLGIAYPITSKLDVYAEACFNSIYDVPLKADATSASINGADILGSMNEENKHSIFKSSYNISNQDPNSPETDSPLKFSFNAVVANIGIRMWF